MVLRIEALTGAALEAALEEVARLRIEVFRAWPYLYDGSLAYERDYLQSYRNSDLAVVAAAYDGETLVGASTGAPLADHAEDFATAFAGTGLDLAEIFYCAESVLLPGCRGQGAGHGFFDAREAFARRHGFRFSAFCSVQRPARHPLKPADYAPFDPFWRKRGYQPLAGAVAQFSWKDVDQPEETAKPLQFWIRSL